MEKRYVVFMVISLGLMVGYVALDLYLYPPALRQQNAANNAQGDGEGKDAKEGKGKDAKDPDGNSGKSDDPAGNGRPNDPPEKKNPEKQDPENQDPENPDPDGTPAIAPPPGPSNPPRWAVLGSYDGSIPGPHAVTFSSLGGGVVRWELVERNDKQRLLYRDLSKRSAYLGVTIWERSKGGCEIRAITPGSPAAAVLQLGDEIQAVDGTPLRSVETLPTLLDERKSGDSIELTLNRGGSKSSVSIQLSQRPLELIRPERTETGAFAGAPPSFLVTIHSIDGVLIDPANPLLHAFQRLKTDHWKMSKVTDQEVEMTYTIDETAMTEMGLSGTLELVKHFKLNPATEAGSEPDNKKHHIHFSVDIKSTADKPMDIVLQVDGPNGVTDEGWWYQQKLHPRMFKQAGARDVVFYAPGFRRIFRGTGEIYSTALKKPQAPVEPFVSEADPEVNRDLRYIAVDTQYFSLALMSGVPGEQNFLVSDAEPRMIGDVEDIPKARMKTTNTTFRVNMTPLTVAPGETVVQSMTIFAGPKRPEVLEAYGLDTLLEYGWFWYVAKPLALVLHTLYAVVRNYGVAIILLTVLVRWIMLPFGRKAARNAMMMQELAPEMNRIKEKYKGDTQKLMDAQRELYKKYGFNPLSGCLPMLFQLPIFLGLYRCLSLDINLRQASLIPGISWCSNLAGPDQFWNWQNTMPGFFSNETGWLGPYLNILPIATIVLFIIQQKMFTPPAQDEQQEMQQKIMKYMMIFIGVLFFKVPAGLCIYFITSSIWGIFERKLMPKPELNAIPTDGSPAPAKSGSSAPDPMEPSKASLVARERARQRRKGRK